LPTKKADCRQGTCDTDSLEKIVYVKKKSASNLMLMHNFLKLKKNSTGLEPSSSALHYIIPYFEVGVFLESVDSC
jgi:hypothetical protein